MAASKRREALAVQCSFASTGDSAQQIIAQCFALYIQQALDNAAISSQLPLLSKTRDSLFAEDVETTYVSGNQQSNDL